MFLFGILAAIPFPDPNPSPKKKSKGSKGAPKPKSKGPPPAPDQPGPGELPQVYGGGMTPMPAIAEDGTPVDPTSGDDAMMNEAGDVSSKLSMMNYAAPQPATSAPSSSRSGPVSLSSYRVAGSPPPRSSGIGNEKNWGGMVHNIMGFVQQMIGQYGHRNPQMINKGFTTKPKADSQGDSGTDPSS